jgi:hypothetical protein
MTDAEFVREAAALNIEIDPVSDEEMRRVVDQSLGTPPAVRERAFRLLD